MMFDDEKASFWEKNLGLHVSFPSGHPRYSDSAPGEDPGSGYYEGSATRNRISVPSVADEQSLKAFVNEAQVHESSFPQSTPARVLHIRASVRSERDPEFRVLESKAEEHHGRSE